MEEVKTNEKEFFYKLNCENSKLLKSDMSFKHVKNTCLFINIIKKKMYFLTC